MVLDVVYRANSKGKNNKRIKSGGVGTASRAELTHSFTLIPGKEEAEENPFLGRSKLLGLL